MIRRAVANVVPAQASAPASASPKAASSRPKSVSRASSNCSGPSTCARDSATRVIILGPPENLYLIFCVEYPRATLSFYAVVDCHWLSSLRDSHSDLAVIADIGCRNDIVAPGFSGSQEISILYRELEVILVWRMFNLAPRHIFLGPESRRGASTGSPAATAVSFARQYRSSREKAVPST